MVREFNAGVEPAHVVGFYDRDADLGPAVAGFLRAALDADGTAIVVATPDHQASIRAALNVDHAVDALMDSGRLIVLDARTTLDSFMHNGAPNRHRFAGAFEPIFADATGPVQVFGEMVALLWEDNLVAAAIDLESRWNELAERFAFDLFCAYPAAALRGDGALEPAKHICDRHTRSMTVGPPTPIEFDGNPEVARVFVPAPAALTDVRGFVREVLHGWDLESEMDEIQLVTSELATNAVLHANSPFRVSLRRDVHIITVAVRDASHDGPVPRTAAPTEPGGRGFALIAAHAQSWGTRPEPDGKTVWATLAPAPVVA